MIMRLLFLLVTILSARSAVGCRCHGNTEMNEAHYNQYQHILVGKVKAIQEREKTRVIEIIVKKKYKGVALSEIVMITAKDTSSCGIMPAVGERWLFCAYQTYLGPQTDTCTRSNHLRSKNRDTRKAVRRDIRYLKKREKMQRVKT